MAKEKEDRVFDIDFLMMAANIVRGHERAKAGAMLMTVIDGIYPVVPDNVDCKKGCSFCCYSRVEITHTEWKAMEVYIRLNKKQGDIQKYLKGAKSNMRKSKKFKGESKYLLRMPCPLLDSDGSCSIYAARPLLCRTAFSKSAKQCELAHNNPKEEIPLPFLNGPRNMAEEIISGIMVAEKKDGKVQWIEEKIIETFK